MKKFCDMSFSRYISHGAIKLNVKKTEIKRFFKKTSCFYFIPIHENLLFIGIEHSL